MSSVRNCPICGNAPMQEIWPFCSVECLRADPRQAADPDWQRRVALFDERCVGAGGPGGMVSVGVDELLGWYLAGAQDEEAVRDGMNWGVKEPTCEPDG